MLVTLVKVGIIIQNSVHFSCNNRRRPRIDFPTNFRCKINWFAANLTVKFGKYLQYQFFPVIKGF